MFEHEQEVSEVNALLKRETGKERGSIQLQNPRLCYTLDSLGMMINIAALVQPLGRQMIEMFHKSTNTPQSMFGLTIDAIKPIDAF